MACAARTEIQAESMRAIDSRGRSWMGQIRQNYVSQQPWPRVPPQVLWALRSQAWGEMIATWPLGYSVETGNREKRDIGRIGDVFRGLFYHVFQAAVLFAPRRFVTADEVTRTDFYRANRLKAGEAQRRILETYTPDHDVPRFNLLQAAGLPGHWNFCLPRCEMRGPNAKHKQEFTPHLTRGTPSI